MLSVAKNSSFPNYLFIFLRKLLISDLKDDKLDDCLTKNTLPTVTGPGSVLPARLL